VALDFWVEGEKLGAAPSRRRKLPRFCGSSPIPDAGEDAER